MCQGCAKASKCSFGINEFIYLDHSLSGAEEFQNDSKLLLL